MSVLVTGATGYLGSAAARALRARGHRVRGTARSGPAADALAAAGVEPVLATLEDPEALRAAMSTVDAVVHTAFPGGDLAAASAAETTGVRAMLDAARDRPFLYTSGIGVVGETGQTRVSEDDPVHPPAWMRWRRELELATVDARHGLVLRPGLVYGRAGGLMLTGLIHAATDSGYSRYVAPGTTTTPTVHVDDVGELIALALDRAAAGTILHGVAGESTPARIAEAVGRLTGKPAVGLTREQATENVPLAAVLDTNQRIAAPRTRRLGWTPTGLPITQEIETGSYRSLLAQR